MKRILIWIVGSALVLGAGVAIWNFGGFGGISQLEAMVQNGKLAGCPKHTLRQMADGFLSSPDWERGKSRDGLEFVNLRGGVVYLDKPVNAAIQFVVDRKAGKFTVNAFALNGIPQNGSFRRALIRKMCKRATELAGKKEKPE